MTVFSLTLEFKRKSSHKNIDTLKAEADNSLTQCWSSFQTFH